MRELFLYYQVKKKPRHFGAVLSFCFFCRNSGFRSGNSGFCSGNSGFVLSARRLTDASGYLSSASARGERAPRAVAGRSVFDRCAPGGELNLLFIAQNARFVNVCAEGAHGTKLFILWRTICARMVRANRERTKNNSESPQSGDSSERSRSDAPHALWARLLCDYWGGGRGARGNCPRAVALYACGK